LQNLPAVAVVALVFDHQSCQNFGFEVEVAAAVVAGQTDRSIQNWQNFAVVVAVAAVAGQRDPEFCGGKILQRHPIHHSGCCS